MADRTLRSSLRWAFALTWGQRGITIVFTILLAAILGPEAFGVVAMAGVFIALVWLVQEQGVTTAIVQRADLEDEHLDSAFWINLVFCIALGAVVVALSGWWADVNDVPELQGVVSALAVVLVIWGLGIVQQAYLQRELQFQKLAIRTNVASLLGGVVGLVLALMGAGVWSLVAQQITFSVVAVSLMWAVSGWYPRFRFSRRHARDILGFSTSVFVANVGGFVNRRGDVLLIGLFFGPVVVGVYRLADRFVDALMELTTRPVGMVSLPHFSRLQHDREALGATVASCMRLVTLTTMPALLALAATSDYVLAFVGPEWEVGADAMKLLCIVGIVKALVHFTGPLLFAVARPLMRALMLWFIAAINIAALVAVGFALESASEESQLLGMSAARALVSVLVIVPLNLLVIRQLAGISIRTMVPWVVAPLTAGIASIAVVEALTATGILDDAPPLLALVVAGGAAVFTALGVLLALEPRARSELKRVRRMLASARRRPLVAADDPVAFVDGIDGPVEDPDGAEGGFADRGVPDSGTDRLVDTDRIGAPAADGAANADDVGRRNVAPNPPVAQEEPRVGRRHAVDP
jgi:O-antigen/teichoic acid export membrane protein